MQTCALLIKTGTGQYRSGGTLLAVLGTQCIGQVRRVEVEDDYAAEDGDASATGRVEVEVEFTTAPLA